MEQLSCICGILIYFIGYSFSYQYEINNLAEDYSWDQAKKACENNGGNLPAIKIIENNGTTFEMVNRDPHLEKECFWVRATYERMDNLTDDRYPNSCCETLFHGEGDTFIKDCMACRSQYHYLCANAGDTIGWSSSSNTSIAPWLTAAQYCSTYGYYLPSDTNAELLKYLPLQRSMWINSVRKINLNPKQGDDPGMLVFLKENSKSRLTL